MKEKGTGKYQKCARMKSKCRLAREDGRAGGDDIGVEQHGYAIRPHPLVLAAVGGEVGVGKDHLSETMDGIDEGEAVGHPVVDVGRAVFQGGGAVEYYTSPYSVSTNTNLRAMPRSGPCPMSAPAIPEKRRSGRHSTGSNDCTVKIGRCLLPAPDDERHTN